MTFDARQIANWFVARYSEDGKNPSIMTLLKMTYIAHGWHLGIKGVPLFSNDIQAWRHGPVIEEVYTLFRKQGDYSTSIAHGFPKEEIEPETVNFLEDVYRKYGRYDAWTLSNLTHKKDSPWDITWREIGEYGEIPDSLIKQHYALKLAQAELKKQQAQAT